MPWITLTRPSASPISAYQATAEAHCRGGIVLIQEIFGVSPHIQEVAEQYAKLGYTVIAPSFFDRYQARLVLDTNAAGYAAGRDIANQLGFDEPLRDVAAAAALLPKPAAVIGYCWGGSLAYLCATRLGLPAISYYGSRTLPFLHERPQAKLMFHFGERDHAIDSDTVAAIANALPNAQLFRYPAGHGFNRPGDDFDAESAALALQRNLQFLDQ